jgi:hypothetical protein
MLNETQQSGISTNTNNRSTVNTTNINTLMIWQQNVNKSQACQHDLISSSRLTREGVDLIVLQEPAINNFGGTGTAKDWTVIYPITHGSEPSKTCSLILICMNIIEMETGDVTAVLLKGSWGMLAIFNMYSDKSSHHICSIL